MKCPKCGSEMKFHDRFALWRSKEPVYGPDPDNYGRDKWGEYICKCGYKKEVFPSWCGHEEKMKPCPNCGALISEESRCIPNCRR